MVFVSDQTYEKYKSEGMTNLAALSKVSKPIHDKTKQMYKEKAKKVVIRNRTEKENREFWEDNTKNVSIINITMEIEVNK